MHPRFRNLVLTVSALLALGLAPAAAGPEGGTVVGGAATIQGQGGAAVIINQSTPSAIINWNTFNIRAGESVRFNQPSSSSVALNRVTGGLGPSQIMGTLTANGRIFLINRDGILFGPGAVVNTAGFLASTNDIRNADFMAGKYNFNIPGRPDASIVNKGTITATSGGFAALVAPGVRNSGTITATLGTVALASGNSFTLDMYGDKLITLAVGDQIASKVLDVATGRPLKSLVSNTRKGTISADGGRVELTAAAARAVVDSVINTRGVIRADSIGSRNGMIVLAAATGASKPAGAPAQTIKISGTLSAAGKDPGTKGGTIIASGEHIKLRRALVDASGHSVGGKVMIGGDWSGGNPNQSLIKNQSAKLEDYAIATATTVSVDRRTKINASASESGNGGKVILWSDSQTTFAGTILARGGAQGGDGGFVEVSSHQLLNYSGTTDTRAPNGKVGTLLLDPENLYINANGLPPRSDPTASAISADTLVNQLASSNVMLSTLQSGTNAGDILVNANISWQTDNSLTLSAYHDITFMSGSKVANTGAGNLVLRADNTGSGQGTVVFNPGGHVDYTSSTGTVSLFYNPSESQTTKYQNPTNYFCPPCPGGGGVFVQQASQLTAYMLVNTTSDLDAVRTNQSGTYALGTKITFDPNQTFTPIPNFTGLFDGQGQVIANLTIASTAQNVGLFGTIANPGEVRNLNLANVSVSADSSSQLVGTVAGINAGTIIDVSATGQVQAGSGSTAGGLVGQNLGTIKGATASGAVTSTGAGSTIGGLVGANEGTITDASASGAVTSTGAGSTVGGLVGANQGTITDATASGAVTSTGANSTVGGFVGVNQGTITGSTASGVVTSTGANSIVGDFVGANFGIIPGGTTPNSPTFPSIVADLQTLPALSLQPLAAFLPEFLASLPAQTQIINNLVQNVQLVALNTAGAPLLNNIQGGINLPPQPPVPTPGAAAAGRQILPGLDRRIIDIPPPGETRMIADEVVVQIAASLDRLQAAIRSLGLTVVESQSLSSTGSIAVRLRITDGRSPADAIRSLARVGMAAIVQPNYVYSLQQPAPDPSPASRGDTGQQGDPAQYILEKLKISDVHRVVRGTNVLIAVIDSEIDAAHPDLEGVIAKRFSAIGAQEKPHPHGTGMAGAIGSHQRLIGTAPAARILAVHAFSTNAANVESTTFNILKGMDWSVNQGVRIINMSFAGPKDPSLERALKLAYDRGIVLIAAAGNAGPKSPPLFPGADPNVIAVTATDVDDKLFNGANRGKYISVAAPGVDILVPAPENSYQLTTGTSVAAAEVSGIVALLLERNPKLTPADIRRILTSSAKRLGTGDRDDNFGSGLIDPLKALQSTDPRTVTTTPPPAPTPLRQR